MLPELSAVVETLCRHEVPTESVIEAAVGCLMDGKCSDAEMASLLTALAVTGETPEQLAGAARAMRDRALRIPTKRTGLLDTCGTGGDRLNTFNISTATALVAAAAGVPVAKHGNRSATSTTGSADVLEHLGVHIALTPELVGRCIDDYGLGFCFARTLHTAMRHVGPVRSLLGFRTIFNLLGPLTNPARAEYQLLGTNRGATAKIMAEAAARLGTTRTFVVCGAEQLDEVSLWGTTVVYDVKGNQIQKHEWSAATFGLPECHVDDLRIQGPEESSKVILQVLQGGVGPARNMVLANTAAALHLTGRAETPLAGVQQAADVIDSGAAIRFLDGFCKLTRECAVEASV